jgi:hypothetical protein
MRVEKRHSKPIPAALLEQAYMCTMSPSVVGHTRFQVAAVHCCRPTDAGTIEQLGKANVHR